ncbi:MAG: YitT family protein [Clostridiales bacterium]|nr:YitT family protein [Clostridiales bacterium]
MKKRAEYLDYLYIVLGTLITSLAFNLFLIPHKIAPGGLSGIATVIYYVSKGRIPVGATMLALNVPLFIIGIKELGGGFGLKTLLSTFLLSFFIDVVKVPSITHEPILASIYGGVVMGIGLGIVFRGNATTGGTDLFAKIIHKHFRFVGVGWVLFVVDSLVVLTAAIVFGPTLALYALVSLYLGSKLIDLILEGAHSAKAFLIISNHSKEIADRIMKELDRGVTLLHGKGAYTMEEKDVIMCVIDRLQTVKLKEIINEIDARAFVLVADVREVMGEGFSLEQ